MDNVTTFAPDGTDRWAALSTEEIRLLAQEHRENPDGVFEAPPESWPDWTDDDIWMITGAEDGHALDLPPTPVEPEFVPSADDERWWGEHAPSDFIPTELGEAIMATSIIGLDDRADEAMAQERYEAGLIG